MNIFCMKESEGCRQESVRMMTLKLHELCMQMTFAEGFYPMEDEKKDRVYPWAEQPDVIWENNCGVQITGQMTEQKVRAEDFYSAVQSFRSLTETTFPDCSISPVHFDERGELSIGWFKMELANRELEHMKALSVIGERMVILTFTYPVAQSLKWRSILRYSLGTWRECYGQS